MTHASDPLRTVVDGNTPRNTIAVFITPVGDSLPSHAIVIAGQHRAAMLQVITTRRLQVAATGPIMREP